MKDLAQFEHEARVDTRPVMWFSLALLGLAVPIALALMLNWLGDSSRIYFRYDAADPLLPRRDNHEYIRIDYLLEQPRHFDLLFVGSSRANSINPQADLATNAYTLSSDGGFSRVFYLQLKAVLENGVSADTVIVGLGEAAYSAAYVPSKVRPQHPAVDGKSAILFHIKYLFKLPTWQNAVLATNRLRDYYLGANKTNDRAFAFISTGRNYCVICEDIANALSPEQRHKDVGKSGKFLAPQSRYSVDEALADIQSIISLAKQHGSKLVFYFDPIFIDRYERMNLADHHRFKRGLAELTPFLDFNTFDPAYQDATNFYDPIHVTEGFGRRMAKDLRSVLQGHPEQAERSVWVTKDNIDAHLAGQQAQQEQRRAIVQH